MDQIEKFNHPLFGELPVMVIDGIEWFGATESAKSLSFADPHKAINNHVDEDGWMVHPVIDSIGRKQNKKFVNESGIYELIFGAAKQGNNQDIKEKAKQFKKWVTSEVLPTIRKTGGYVQENRAIDFVQSWLPHLDESSKQAVAATLEHNQKLLVENTSLKTTLKEQAPKVVFAEAVEISTNSILVKDLATLLKQKGINIGQNRLFIWLRENGYLCKKGSMYNKPTQRSLNLGLFELKPYVRSSSNGEMKTEFTPKVTGKGQIYFVNKFLALQNAV
ncbi:phage antirepressor KilAC domain-containing protein [Bacillus infantis]|nr:phage antirepressor KilAC domain-containing protein [Bacillus infantis]MCK6203975.1 phage antirepressor KilAC domain-containing protein [Bacillus infantis]